MRMNQSERADMIAAYRTTMSNRETLAEAYRETVTGNPAETIDRLVSILGYPAAVETVAEIVNSVGDWDGRISKSNRRWAQIIDTAATMEELEARGIYTPSAIHPAHIDQLAAAISFFRASISRKTWSDLFSK